MNPMEYGERVQGALRELIEARFDERDSPVRSRSALSKALGHGDARQYVASRFKPQGTKGEIRDMTVPDLVAFAGALGLNAAELLDRARVIVDGETDSEATIHQFPEVSDLAGTMGAVATPETMVEPGDLEE